MNSDMSPSVSAAHLRCSDPACRATADLDDGLLECPRCGDLLEVVVPPPTIEPEALVDLWSLRRLSRDPRDASGVWRFREFLPSYRADDIVTLQEGNTPLLDAPRSA